ncbi:uncharacterized protein LOC110225627 [Arabidopsis lyrata subsp. lyrata]|uniref:uncharacterized protein LOC110225627 n=1 Tax=Arabidopsis lyrata subsp. lyrata TaxID=81972 RepID=UPI000A29D946|nr:uncharacterized protein LOC110225627 [Arabidopsis lyrata subsp. lyrata]XP_020871075.1 uncharacterized protein LOC110225627 [Arabidopsis lyrata subsp. lyrata]|eukprot:XP_020871070.1 uncharacterized protein LOC110225627 [Arabidopsis lyrata subsp. lyrata]
MGRPNKKGGQKKKSKAAKDTDEPEFICTVEPQTEAAEVQGEQETEAAEVQEEEHRSDVDVTEAAEVTANNEEEAEGELELTDENERPAKRKRHRGPTKMKNIAKDPNVRERVDYTLMGDPYGPGSVKLSSYVGPLVREHVPITIDTWKNVSEEIKTVLWKSIQARFELDEEFQKVAVLKQMGNLWRSYKSRIVRDINGATNNQQRMNLRPNNINPADWQKFVKIKTSASFKVVSDKYKERRRKQIPHTTSRKGMVRLAEDMKIESGDPSEVTRLKVWVKSRTKKDGTPVNTNAAEKIKKAAELVGSDAPTLTTNPDAFLWRPASNMFTVEEAVGQIIAWPASKCVLVDKDIQIEDIAPLGLRTNSLNKCKLLDLSSDEVIVAEGRWQTQEPSALVNGLPLGPKAIKVFVDQVHQPETFIWRPTMEMTYLEDCVMAFVSWPVSKVVFENSTTGHKSPLQNSAATVSGSKSVAGAKSATSGPKSTTGTGSESPIEDATGTSSPMKKTLPDSQSPLRKSQRISNQVVSKENKKCKLMDITGRKRVVAEGRWVSNDPDMKVHFVPLGSNGVKVWVDIVKVSDAAVWRPSDEIVSLEDAFGTTLAWPDDKVIMC